MKAETTKCVVLNATYEPITVVSARRALILYFEGKATIVEEHPTHIIRSAKQEFKLPTQIVLKSFVRGRPIFRTKAILTQRNLFARDANTCQYCGRTKSQLRRNESLTRDHVTPRDLGGKDVWENVVTCCNTCNNKKSNLTLDTLGWKLLKQPTAPTLYEIWSKRQRTRDAHTE